MVYYRQFAEEQIRGQYYRMLNVIGMQQNVAMQIAFGHFDEKEGKITE